MLDQVLESLDSEIQSKKSNKDAALAVVWNAQIEKIWSESKLRTRISTNAALVYSQQLLDRGTSLLEVIELFELLAKCFHSAFDGGFNIGYQAGKRIAELEQLEKLDR